MFLFKLKMTSLALVLPTLISLGLHLWNFYPWCISCSGWHVTLMLPAVQSCARLHLGGKRHFRGNEMHKLNMKKRISWDAVLLSVTRRWDRIDGGEGFISMMITLFLPILKLCIDLWTLISCQNTPRPSNTNDQTAKVIQDKDKVCVVHFVAIQCC